MSAWGSAATAMRVPRFACAVVITLTITVSNVTRAAIITVHEGTSLPTVNGFDWTYRASVPDRARVKSGDFFTIYDFAGFTGTHFEPANWTFISQLQGPVPVMIALEGDDPLIPNLTWRYDGLTEIVGSAEAGTVLGQFAARSLFSEQISDWYAAQATQNGGPLDGTPISNRALEVVPVPEPGILALAAAGPAILLLRRRRRRRH